MKLSISNIAWGEEDDSKVYDLMKKYKFEGIEIAPTRVIPNNPYEQIKKAIEWKKALKEQYGFEVSSMQSIWYGRQENLFGSTEERNELLSYTKKAIEFASSIECKNIVFGCPRNRNKPQEADEMTAISFFRELGECAIKKGIVIGMEANPPIYNTNYINDTISAVELIKKVNSKGFRLNFDIGTMIINNESIEMLEEALPYINHVHISEPLLKMIENRILHKQIFEVLKKEKYSGYVSIEMGKADNTDIIEERLNYVNRIFRRE